MNNGRNLPPSNFASRVRGAISLNHCVRNWRWFVMFFTAFALSSLQLHATVYNVGTLANLITRINAANPGDQIILSNGVYSSTGTITISRSGTATQPILIAAQSIGGAQIGGVDGFNFVGANYVTVQGFYFTYTNVAQNGLVVDTASTHCRITRNIFEIDPVQYWCFVQGDDTEVDHNLFRNKVQKGEYLTLDGNHTTLRIARRLWAHDNDFFNNHYSGGNGGESTRLGLGIFKLISAWSVVENNLYEQANGDPEAISVKTSDDVIRYNTITNNFQGTISLRQGCRNRVEGNFIFNADGMKFYADDHLIFNNYLQGAISGIQFGAGAYSEITDSDNVDNTGPHAAAHRARVEFNTMVNCSVYLDWNNQGPYVPTDCLVEDNILQGNSGYFVTQNLLTGETNFTWLTNIFWGAASTAYSPAGGYSKVNPLLTNNPAVPYHIASNSPAIGASYAAPGEVATDMDGQPRVGTPAIGADEYSTAPVTHHPLGTNDVGPYVVATNFAIVAMPWIQTVMPGRVTSYTNLISAYNGFTNLITLSVSNLPPNSSASFNSTTVTNGLGFSVLSVTTSNSTPPGRYTVLITATSAIFTNSTIACLTVGNLPTNWTDADIGAPAMQGSADFYQNVFAVKGGGNQIFGSTDQFNFAYQRWTNGVTVTARVITEPATATSAKAGVMIRESTNASSKFVDVVVTPSSINLEARTATGGNALTLASFTAANSTVGTNSPSWVKLVLSSGSFTAYASADGVSWAQMGATNISMTNTLAGLAVCSSDTSQLNTSTFDNVTLASAPANYFDLSRWYLQLPTSNNILTGTSGTVDSASTAQLLAGFSNPYFYLASDGAMTFWVPDNGSMTSGSIHPRSELREELIPGNTDTNWTLYGTHLLTATCVVSNVPSDTKKVCIAQVHEQIGAAIPMVMIMFYNNTIYADIWSNGNDNNSSSSYPFGAGGLGVPINYFIAVTNGVLTVGVNGVITSVDLFNNGSNWQTNAVYFKAGAYSQTTNQCNCSTDGAQVAFYALSHTHAPSIISQPVNSAVSAGSTTSFSVSALDWTGMTYQWFFNGTNALPGMTNATLTISNVAGTNLGNYTVVVSDGYGVVTSSIAILSTTAAPSITNQPASQNIQRGSTGVLSVGVSGNSPLSYQWFFNGTIFLGANTNVLTLPNFQLANAGNYSVVVTNIFGVTTSAVATLTLVVSSTNLVLDDQWLDATRTNTSLPAEAAWYANVAASLTAKTNALIGTPDPASTMTWWTYFTSNSAAPVQLKMSDSLRITLAFTTSGVNASNSSKGLRIGLFNSSAGTRTVVDGAVPIGTNHTGIMGNLNFGQTFGSGFLFLERTNYSSVNLISTTSDYSSDPASISTLGGPAAGDAGFSNGVPYVMQLLATRNTNAIGLSLAFTGTNGWSNAVTGTWADTNYLATAFDTFVFRPALQAQSSTNFTFTEFKVEVLAPNNRPPVPGIHSVVTTQNSPVNIATTNLLATDSDPDGDTLAITGVSSASTNGGAVTLVAGNITYTPVANYVGADQITYSLTDGRGSSSTGNISVTVAGPPTFTSFNLTSGGSAFSLAGTGVAGQTYVLQTASNLAPPVAWISIVTNPAGTNGFFNFTDNQVTNFNQRFYRVMKP
jgi:poly(beta-D-mannuronate) lyase